MIVNRAALKRPVAVLVFMILSAVTGLYSYNSLPRESSPDITIPYVFVTTTYEGVAPADVEKLITLPLERKLKGIADTEEIRSTSEDGISVIAVKFLPDVDIDDALQKVRDKVDQAKPDLPKDLEDDPVITEANFSDIPVVQVVLSGPFSLRRLKDFAEDLRDRFEAVQGVLEAKIVGGLEREIHVLFDLDRVAFYNVPFSSLLSSVERGNVNQPGGSMDIGSSRYLVRVPEDFKHPAEINNIVAFVRDGRPVYLRDLATIADANKDPLSLSRIDGKASVTILIKKRSGENIIRISDEVAAIVAEMRDVLPRNLSVDLTADQAEEIRNMVADLENNIISGLLLVLAVVFLFIGGRSAVFVSLAIPLSMLLSFSLLQAMGVTLNMVVLFSLTLALGMLVDNGIVIVENIYRHMQENGLPRGQAALTATDEVAWPVITSTLTTVGAFLPMIFWPGIMGEFMKFLPITVILTLSASLFVALVINPVLSARYQNVRPLGQTTAVDRILDRVRDAYGRILEKALAHRGLVLAGAFALLVLSIVGFGVFGRGVEFFPDVEPNRAYIHIKAPPGTNLDASDELVRQAEVIASQYPDIRHVISEIGAEGNDPFSQGGTGTHLSKITLDFKNIKDRSRPSSEIVNEIRAKLQDAIRGAEVRVEKEQGGPPTGAAVNMEIAGEDIHDLGRLAAEVRKAIRDIPGLVDLKDDFVSGKPEILVSVDKEKAALLGLDALSVATTVKAAINGAKVGAYREGKDEYDILVKLPEKDRHSVEILRRLTVSGSAGQPVPITSLASVELASGLGGIHRIDQKRVVTISADASGRLANDIITDIKARLADFPWPKGYRVSYTGEQKEQDKAQDFLSKAFLAALFLIFMTLVLQFDTLMSPVIILTSVVLSLIGVFLGLLVTDMPFGVTMTGVGVVSLAGVVVNNAIVLIDYYNQLRAGGMASREALVLTGRLRFRPVALTALTTVLGLVPMATGVSFDFLNFRWDVGGESSQWWGSMAVAVIFGLAVATLLTLVVVPVLLSFQESLRTRRQRSDTENKTGHTDS